MMKKVAKTPQALVLAVVEVELPLAAVSSLHQTHRDLHPWRGLKAQVCQRGPQDVVEAGLPGYKRACKGHRDAEEADCNTVSAGDMCFHVQVVGHLVDSREFGIENCIVKLGGPYRARTRLRDKAMSQEDTLPAYCH